MAAAVDGLFAELLGLHDAIRLAGDSFVRTAGLEHAYPDLLLAPDNQSAAGSRDFGAQGSRPYARNGPSCKQRRVARLVVAG